jgi:hypothetical protein
VKRGVPKGRRAFFLRAADRIKCWTGAASAHSARAQPREKKEPVKKRAFLFDATGG